MSSTLATFFVMLVSLGCAGTGTSDAPRAHDGRLTADSSIDQILDALDARGDGLQSFAADVKMTESDPDTGDASTRSGKVWLQMKTDGATRFRAMFDKKQANNRIVEDRVEYVLEGPNLIDRTYHSKTQVTRQVLKPGERINLLKLGEGPFPLPIGQDKSEVHRAFEVTRVSPRGDDPPNSVHVTLVPKAGSQFERKFKSIDVWVDLEDHMPKRIETLDPNGVTLRTTDMTNMKINPALTDTDFAMPKIDGSWTLMEEAYNDKPNQPRRDK